MGELSKENSLQREAFEIYYLLGDKRSLRAVAEKIDRTERTVAGWSRKFSWVDRVSQRQIEENKTAGEATVLLAQTVEAKTKYRIMMNNLLAMASRKIANGDLGIKSVADLERVVKLDLLLMGEATDRQESNNKAELSTADVERLDEVIKLLGVEK
jgi:hypothetical protein